jgi:hypothetical protein
MGLLYLQHNPQVPSLVPACLIPNSCSLSVPAGQHLKSHRVPIFICTPRVLRASLPFWTLSSQNPVTLQLFLLSPLGSWECCHINDSRA